MLDQQKDWTFKLFLHNFFKENNLKSSLTSFENEVLQTPNFNQDLPIKSNRTFLLEMWNIFFHLYSEELMKDFAVKNTANFPKDLINGVTFADLFKPGVLNPNQNGNYFNNMDLNNLINTNPYILSTLESFKNFSRSFNTMNPMNNMNTMNTMNFPFNNANVPLTTNYDLPTVPKAYPQYSTINNIPFQKDYMGMQNKIGSETSSISMSSEQQVPKVNESRITHKIFNTNSTVMRSSRSEIDIMNKKRKRYIKNNKFVYVHPGSAAAKKMELEKEANEKIQEEELAEDSEELNDFNVKDQNNSNDHSDTSNKGKKPRGSRYRGVSRNGNQWQVLIMVNKKKRYVGSYSNEEEAARAYDKVALQNHGTKAKTNFDYVDEEVKKILSEPPLLKIYY